jgi:hypothetical protein
MANGYYNDDALATSFSDAVARFAGGKVSSHRRHLGPGDISAGLGENAGFMLSRLAERQARGRGRYSLPWTIRPVPDPGLRGGVHRLRDGRPRGDPDSRSRPVDLGGTRWR